ncbi:hypothetical protein [Streptomyces mayteni]
MLRADCSGSVISWPTTAGDKASPWSIGGPTLGTDLREFAQDKQDDGE